MSLTLRYPLQLDGVGRPLATSDASSIWIDRVQVLLSTMLGERPSDLFYGADLASAVFMPADMVESEVTNTVITAFSRYLPALQVHDVTVDTSNPTSGVVPVSITFTIPEGSEIEVSSVVDLTTLGLG